VYHSVIFKHNVLQLPVIWHLYDIRFKPQCKAL